MGFFSFITDTLQAPARWTAQALGSVTGAGEFEKLDDRMRNNADNNSWGGMLNSAIDPTQTTNPLAASTGKLLPTWMKQGTFPALVDTIGAIAYGPVGIMATSGLTSQLNDEPPDNAFKKAATKGAMTYAGQQAGGMMSNTGSTAPTGSEGYFQTNTSLAPTSDYTGGQYFQVDQALAPASSASSGAAGASAGYGAEYGAVPQNNYFTADQSLAPTNSIDPYADPYSYNPAVDAPQTPQDYAFLRKVIDDPRTTEVAKMAAKKALGELWNAGIAGMMGSMQTFNPQANPTPINTDYAYNAFTPTSQAAPLSEMTGLMDPNWNVRTPGISLEKPNDYMDLASYSLLKEAEKKKKEDLEKSLSGSLQPDQYSRDYYTALA
jgi:hypothetical protein